MVKSKGCFDILGDGGEEEFCLSCGAREMDKYKLIFGVEVGAEYIGRRVGCCSLKL